MHDAGRHQTLSLLVFLPLASLAAAHYHHNGDFRFIIPHRIFLAQTRAATIHLATHNIAQPRAANRYLQRQGQTMSGTIAELDARHKELSHELQRVQRELADLNRQYGGSVANHTLTGPDGNEISLRQLFGQRTDLIVVHNMGRRCSYCTMWADGFNGLYHHLVDRAAFAVVSPDPPDVQRAFADSRGWKFPMYSDPTGDFTRAMGFIHEQEAKQYWMPGYSTFELDHADGIRRVARDHFGPGDAYCSAWPMFELLAGGAGNWGPSIDYGQSTQHSRSIP